MSVVAHSPYSGAKRLFDENDSPDSRYIAQQQAKRVRYFGSPAGRCLPHANEPGSYALPACAVTALRALFPDMDEQTVSDVLVECGNNIDAAIKRLGELRLQPLEEPELNHHSVRIPQASIPRQADAAVPQRAEDWIELFVQEMAAAKDLTDARRRTSALLQGFEHTVRSRADGEVSHTRHELNEMKAKLDDLVKENQILKRAVQIQNARMQDVVAKEQELSQLKLLLAQYQEQVRTLELSNYSLALHLQKATSADPIRGQRPPDVF